MTITKHDIDRLHAASRRIRRKAWLAYGADDLAQDTAAHWCRYGQDAQSFIGWTIHAAWQIQQQRRRRETVREPELQRDSDRIEVAVELDPVDLLIAQETAQQAMQAIAALPRRDVEVLAFRMQGIDDNQAAQKFRMSPEAVRQVVCRARRKIERAIR